jgi:hypothetical protein
MGRPLTEQEKESVRGEMARQAEAVTRLEVEPVLQQLMAELSARAAVHMGLMPNPYTRLIAKNDAQARLAIDAFGAMFEIIKPHLDGAASASTPEYSTICASTSFRSPAVQPAAAPAASFINNQRRGRTA